MSNVQLATCVLAHQQQRQAAQGHDQGVVVDRGGDENVHRGKGVHRRRAQRQVGVLRQQLAPDEVGQSDRRRAHRDGEKADDVDRQHRPAPGERFQRRVVDDQVDVAVGGSAGVNVGIEVAHRLQVGGIYPAGRQRGDEIIERRLAALLPPGGFHARLLHRQRPIVGDVLDHWVMPLFVRGLERRDDDAIDCAQENKKGQYDDQYVSGFHLLYPVMRIARRPLLGCAPLRAKPRTTLKRSSRTQRWVKYTPVLVLPQIWGQPGKI